MTAPPICKKPPQPPLAPLPPWPPWLLAYVSLTYNLAEGVNWHVAGFTKLLPAGPLGLYTGQIVRGTKTLAITCQLTIVPPALLVELEGNTEHPPGDHAISDGNLIKPGLAWLVHPSTWWPGPPYQSADAQITT